MRCNLYIFLLYHLIQYLSIRDYIMHMCQKNNKDASEVWIKMKPEFKEEVSDKIRTFKLTTYGIV